MKYDVITIGGATRDISFFTDEGILVGNKGDLLRQNLLAFEYGAKIKVDKFYNLFGGGAVNAAVNFANSGFEVACLAKIGNDHHGREIAANLVARGVSTRLLAIDQKEPSGLSFVLVTASGERVIFSSRSANNNLSITKNEMSLLSLGKWLYITSLSGSWLPAARNIFSIPGPRIAWNPGAAQYQLGLKKLSPFLKRTDVFCVNKDEAIELVMSDERYAKKKAAFLNNTENLLVILKNAGPKMVLITSGSDGADVYDGHKFYHQGIIKEKKRVDITGVGDAFNSSFIAGLELTGGNIKKSLLMSAKNTASKIAHYGAQGGLLDLRKMK
ncbi:MAG: carbohydrate kinase family protein [bacterium]|nr:carbohydrate kinase family protein [bacterium]